MTETLNKDKSTILQKSYIQKSKIFLLPLTGIRRERFYFPSNTYIASPDLIAEEYPMGINKDSNILIVCFPKKLREESDRILKVVKSKNIVDENEIPQWEKYEIEVLFSNKNFIAFHESRDELVYTFDLSSFKRDWIKFLNGRYSLFTEDCKQIITNYRKNTLKEIEKRKLVCYLYPYKEDCLKEFAEQLGENINDLKQVKELCNKPDIEKETFRI